MTFEAVAHGGAASQSMTRVISAAPVTHVAVDELDLRFASLRLVQPVLAARLVASVKREGIRQPVLAATEVEPQRRVLVDGFKRVRAARELGIASVSTSMLALNGPAALAMMLRANAPQQGMSALEEGWIVRRLCREHGLTQVQAGSLLGHEQSWVSLRLRLIEQLEEALQEDMRLGLLMPTVARELSRLPRAQQVSAAAVVRDQGLLSRQTSWLVRSLLQNDDPSMRRQILADPLRYITPEQSPAANKAKTTDPRMSPSGNKLRQSLLFFEGAASRLCGSLLSYAPDGLHGEQARILAPALRQALAAGSRAVVQLEEVCRGNRETHAGLRAAEPSRPEKGVADADPR